MVMRRFIILKIQPLQVLAIKIETRLLLIKPFTVKVLITIGDTKESWVIVSLTTRQAFKLWAPTATAVQVVVYENTSNDAPVWKTFNLERGNSYSYSHKYNTIGVWSVDLDENLAGKAYQYQIEFPHHQTLTRDPYTIATSPDGKRSIILSAR